jgi:hypothetical protein
MTVVVPPRRNVEVHAGAMTPVIAVVIVVVVAAIATMHLLDIGIGTRGLQAFYAAHRRGLCRQRCITQGEGAYGGNEPSSELHPILSFIS